MRRARVAGAPPGADLARRHHRASCWPGTGRPWLSEAVMTRMKARIERIAGIGLDSFGA